MTREPNPGHPWPLYREATPDGPELTWAPRDPDLGGPVADATFRVERVDRFVQVTRFDAHGTRVDHQQYRRRFD